MKLFVNMQIQAAKRPGRQWADDYAKLVSELVGALSPIDHRGLHKTCLCETDGINKAIRRFETPRSRTIIAQNVSPRTTA